MRRIAGTKMSYARWGEDSHVYVYEGGSGYECCRCVLFGGTQSFESIDGIIEHLYEHQNNGDKVPGYAFVELAWVYERERIIKLLEDYSDGELLVVVYADIADLINGENK
jgi:hypothetical protein